MFKNMGEIRIADQFSGSDAGEKIAAALDDLPSTGGTVDARGFEGAQTISSTITIDKPATLLFGAATYTVSALTDLFEITEKGVAIIGMGRGQRLEDSGFAGNTRFVLSSSEEGGTQHLIATDQHSLTLKNVTFEGAGSSVGNNGGIRLTTSPTAVFEDVVIDNVLVTKCAHGDGAVYCSYLIMSRFTNLTVEDAGGYGIRLEGGTSQIFEVCYVFGALKAGFLLNGSNYIFLSGCASESNGLGFEVNGVNNATLISCAVES